MIPRHLVRLSPVHSLQAARVWDEHGVPSSWGVQTGPLVKSEIFDAAKASSRNLCTETEIIDTPKPASSETRKWG